MAVAWLHWAERWKLKLAEQSSPLVCAPSSVHVASSHRGIARAGRPATVSELRQTVPVDGAVTTMRSMLLCSASPVNVLASPLIPIPAIVAVPCTASKAPRRCQSAGPRGLGKRAGGAAS